MGQLERLGVGFNQSFAARNHRDLVLLSKLASLVLVAQPAHRLLGRADKLDVARPAHLSEMRIL